MKLRAYQEVLVERILAAIERNPLCVLPTGAGKTIVAVEIVRRLGRRVLWVAHRRELIQQAADHLTQAGLEVGIILAGEASNPDALVQVASVQTLLRRTAPESDLVVIDEAHHAVADSYRRVISNGCPLLGLSATPFRLDGRGLGDFGFGEIVVGAHVDDLVRDGYLVEPEVWGAKGPDLSGVRTRAGEFAVRELAKVMGSRKLIADLVETWIARAAGRRTVCFAVDVEHSVAIVERFRAAGVQAEHLDGTTPKVDRDAILARVASAATHVVSNCMVLTEGWDLPALEAAIIARPTQSLNLHLQMLGRIMRACEDKAGAIVLDHAGNWARHGPVTQQLTYSLKDRVRKVDEVSMKPTVGAGQRFDVLELDGDLEPVRGLEAPFAVRAAFWRRVHGEMHDRGYKAGYPYARYLGRFGEPPVADGNRLIDPDRATRADKRAIYQQLLAVCARKDFKSGWAAHRYRAIFGVWPRGVS